MPDYFVKAVELSTVADAISSSPLRSSMMWPSDYIAAVSSISAASKVLNSYFSSGGISNEYVTSVFDANVESFSSIRGWLFYSNLYQSSVLNLPNVVKIGDRAFQGCSSINEIIMPNAVVVGDYAFYNCDGIESISLSNVEYLHQGAFGNCNSLSSVDLPKVSVVDASAFASCTSLVDVKLPSAETVGVYAFQGCSSLESISMPDASRIREYAFFGCSKLSEVYLPNVSIISSYAFSNCMSLISLNLPKVTEIGSGAFSNCRGLSYASLPSVTRIGAYAFHYCNSMSFVYMPCVTYIGTEAFAFCHLLDNVNLPNLSTLQTSAFNACLSLKTVTLPSVTFIGSYAFSACRNLLSLYLPGSSVPVLSSWAFNYSPIGGSTASTGGVYGSIYVPASLYSTYISATNWSIYSSRIASMRAPVPVVTDLTNTKWVFKKTLSQSSLSSDNPYDIVFQDQNGYIRNGIWASLDNSDNCVYDYLGEDIYYENGSWTGTGRIVDVLSGIDTTNPDMIQWFKDNAVQITINDLAGTSWYMKEPCEESMYGIHGYYSSIHYTVPFTAGSLSGTRIVFHRSNQYTTCDLVSVDDVDTIIDGVDGTYTSQDYRNISVTRSAQDSANVDLIGWFFLNGELLA